MYAFRFGLNSRSFQLRRRMCFCIFFHHPSCFSLILLTRTHRTLLIEILRNWDTTKNWFDMHTLAGFLETLPSRGKCSPEVDDLRMVRFYLWCFFAGALNFVLFSQRLLAFCSAQQRTYVMPIIVLFSMIGLTVLSVILFKG